MSVGLYFRLKAIALKAARGDMKRKLRITKRTEVDNTITYIVQRRKFMIWRDAVSDIRPNSFKRAETARQGICYFNGSKRKDVVIELIEG